MQLFQGSSILDLLSLRQREVHCERVQLIGCKITQQVILQVNSVFRGCGYGRGKSRIDFKFLQPSTEFNHMWKKESQKHVCIGLDRCLNPHA